MTKHRINFLEGIPWGKPVWPWVYNLDQFMTIEQGCAELGITVRAFSKWQIKELAPPRYRLGHKRVLFREDVMAIKSRISGPLASTVL